MFEEIVGSLTMNADDPATRIPIEEVMADVASGHVYYVFRGTRTRDVEVVSAADQDEGLTIPAGVPWVSGPWRAKFDGVGQNIEGNFQFLRAPSTTSCDVLVVRGEGSAFVNKSLSSQSVGTTQVSGNPMVSAGSQIMTPGNSTKIDVQPASQGSVTKGKCEVTYINHGTEQVWVNEQGVAAAEGILLDPKDAWTDEEVTVSPTQHTVYFPSSDGIGSNPGTGDDEDKLIIRFREEG